MRKVCRVFTRSLSKVRLVVVLTVIVVGATVSLVFASGQSTSTSIVPIGNNHKAKADFTATILSVGSEARGYVTGTTRYYSMSGQPCDLSQCDVVAFSVVVFEYADGSRKTLRSQMIPLWSMESMAYAPAGATMSVTYVEGWRPRLWDTTKNTTVEYADRRSIHDNR